MDGMDGWLGGEESFVRFIDRGEGLSGGGLWLRTKRRTKSWSGIRT